MQFSAFAPFGLFAFSSKPSPAKEAYDALKSGLGPAYDMTPGASYVEARTFAQAIAIGCTRATIQRAYNQKRPLTAIDMLGVLEKDYGITPGPYDTIPQRQAAVHARELLMQGATDAAVTTDLRALLGDALLKYRVMKPSEVILWPATSADAGTTGSWQDPVRKDPRFYKLLDPVDAVIGTPTVRTVRVQAVNDSTTPYVGETLCFEPNVNLVAEKVTPTAVSEVAPGAALGSWYVTASFSRPHSVGGWVLTHAPVWTSTQRLVNVIVTAAVATDVEMRRKIGLIMSRHMKTTTRWQIVAAASTTTVGPFVCGVGRAGSTAIGATAFTF